MTHFDLFGYSFLGRAQSVISSGAARGTTTRHTQNPYTHNLDDAKLTSDRPGLAEVVWLGDSREVLRGFPVPAQKELGYALYRVQLGQMPPDSKPMKTVGPGVYELREQDERASYRVFYLKKIAGVIYVLHCFEERTAQTEKKDIEVARERLKRLREQQGTKKKHADRPPHKRKRS